jgi:dTDP-glucose 4,6-dehydratase
MMRVLIIGGTGFISSRLVSKLIERNHDVTILNRGISAGKELCDGVRVLKADRNDEKALRRAVKGNWFDAVYDMVAYEARDSELAVRVFKGNVGRFIHCSTISVYMVSNDIQCPITEDQDKRPLMKFFPRSPFGMMYGINKRQCEEVLWEAHDAIEFPVSMLRPTFVSGPGDPAKRDFFWIERILDGGPLLVPGSGDHAFQNVFLDDVAEAFVRLIEVPESIGHAYNVAAEEIFSLNDYLRLLGRFLNREPEIVHIDQEYFDKLPLSVSSEGDVFPFNTRRTAVFSLERIRRDLGYRPTPTTVWLPKTIEWYRKEFKGHSNGYQRRQQEINIALKWKQVHTTLHRELSYD